MLTSAYYNEHDPFAAEWLRELIKAGLIAPGEVDERDIQDVRPSELRGFTQCHFFAGIGGWSYALRSAGWPDAQHVWTGSCPCQPFSSAGKRSGVDDKRHLWPAWFHLIEQRKPDTIFGEQVASKDGLAWLDVVSSDLEGTGYAIGAVDTCAAGFGAPHIRQRLYFVADSTSVRCEQQRNSTTTALQGQCTERSREHARPQCEGELPGGFEGLCGVGDLTNGFWRDAEWLWHRDEKYRPVEAGTFPLAHGVTNRVGELRGFGNALVAPQAQAFIEAYIECRRGEIQSGKENH